MLRKILSFIKVKTPEAPRTTIIGNIPESYFELNLIYDKDLVNIIQLCLYRYFMKTKTKWIPFVSFIHSESNIGYIKVRWELIKDNYISLLYKNTVLENTYVCNKFKVLLKAGFIIDKISEVSELTHDNGEYNLSEPIIDSATPNELACICKTHLSSSYTTLDKTNYQPFENHETLFMVDSILQSIIDAYRKFMKNPIYTHEIKTVPYTNEYLELINKIEESRL